MTEGTARRAWRAGLAAAIAALVLLGWTQRHRFVSVDLGGAAPEYSARTLDGREYSLASLRGKVVVLNVWATWCAPCVKEMPTLQRAHDLLKSEGLEVVAVSVDAEAGGLDAFGNPGGDVAAFVRDHGLTFTVLHDPRRRIEGLFAIYGLPATFVLDRS
ncbi:MAG TPA: TlpA disulfide reductase family protein, partial [Longimicrobiales bacterium]|nr:TlpA disulfide reductase family protein [Longimicrobiales bacterium]